MTTSTLAASLVLVTLVGCQQAPLPGARKHAGRHPPPAADHLDSRKPLPLLPMMAQHQKENMRDHLVAVQEIVQALARKDYAAVDRAGARIGHSDQMGMMCNHMGAAAPGFTEQALAFHRTADGIGVAARKKDHAGVLTALGDTLSSCTACHATWKQQVVDEASWKSLTAATPR